MSALEIAIANEILRGVVGSSAHGLHLAGQDDRDEMGIFIEPSENVCGLHSVDHYIYRDQPNGVRSQPGDLDLTLYSLRKFCRLAAQGNPSVLVLLWLPAYVVKTSLGEALLWLRDAFFSREAGKRFSGYLHSQKMGLLGKRTKAVTRPELIEQYGYDTKYAMHALRLAYEGIEYMSTRRLTLPVPEPRLGTLRAVRIGEISFSEILRLIEDAEDLLTQHVARCEIARADSLRIDSFLVSAHQAHWGEEAPGVQINGRRKDSYE